jgi:tetratricopeptide (TPR) repeat protein
MHSATRALAISIRVITLGVCCFAIWSSWNLARADHLFRLDTQESIQTAIRLVPDHPRYYLRLAQLDEANARTLLEKALQLNQYDAEADVDLALRYEADGEYNRAEKLMLAAFSVDHTYMPRWTLANFYFRRDDMPSFWSWARLAALMPSDTSIPLFDLCWHATPDADYISKAILTDNPELIRQFVTFLRSKNQLPAAAKVSQRLLQFSTPEADRSLLLTLVDQLARTGHPQDARDLWSRLVSQRWIDGEITEPNNASFARTPLPLAFDWSFPSYPGVFCSTGLSGLQAEFSGDQPEAFIVAVQSVVLAPGNYTVDYAYHTSGVAPDTGLQWEVNFADTGKPLAQSPFLSSETLQKSSFNLSVPQNASLLELRLVYRRAVGTTRIAGTLMVPSIQILPESRK